jgi:hypothetical protein
MHRRSLILILLLICVTFVIAGLWPFDFFPANRAALLHKERGLRLTGVGNARSREPFSVSDTLFRNSVFSIEMLIRPQREPTEDVPSIISLCDTNGTERLILGQWKDLLIIRSAGRTSSASKRYREIGVAGALRREQTRLITITAGERGTSVFLDGVLSAAFPQFSLLPGPEIVTGYLVIGTAFARKSFWSGDLLGLKLYDRALPEREIRLHARTGTLFDIHPSRSDHGLIAAYDFDQHDAPLVVNRSGSLPDMIIPDTFQPVRRTMLELPWEREWRMLTAAEDITINIAGFLPFGFFFALLVRRGSSLSPTLIAIIVVAAGAAISLAIEVTQAYLPMRNSSATDLACNICGTFVGAVALLKSRRAAR